MIGRILYRKAISRLLDHILSKKRKTRCARNASRHTTGATARDMRASTRLASGAAPVSARAGAAPRHAAREEARTRRGLFPRRSARWARSSARVPRRARVGAGPRRGVLRVDRRQGSRPPASASGTSAGGSPTTTRRTGVASPPHPSRRYVVGISIARSFLESSRKVMEVEASPKRFAFFSSRRFERRVRDPLPSPRARRAPRRNVFLPVRPSRCR